MAIIFNDELIEYRILRVKDISFEVNEELYNKSYSPEQTQVRINCEIKYNTEANYVILALNGIYLYVVDEKDQIFADIIVHNVFEIKNIIRFVKGTELILPPKILVPLMGYSLSHTRALFSKCIDGTAFNGLTLPLIEPIAVATSLFPHMFEIQNADAMAGESTA